MGANLPGGASSLGFIRRCRDLVELYYGARMVVAIIENEWFPSATPQQILLQDPRRIRYELILANNDTVNMQTVNIGSLSPQGGLNPQQYNVPANGTIIVERSFLADMDAVCLPLYATGTSENVTVSTRETFLTPPPVDETP